MAEAALKPTVYVETTIPSYLTAWPNRDLRRASHQQITKVWWRTAATQFDLFISDVVVEECSRGDAQAASERLAILREIPVLARSKEAVSLSTEYVQLLTLPPKAISDALHIAYATVYGIDYLVTWNMRHMASSLTMRRLTEYNLANGLAVPLIVTPEALETSTFDEQELEP
jgi:predicted nucleic acid-binding protein